MNDVGWRDPYHTIEYVTLQLFATTRSIWLTVHNSHALCVTPHSMFALSVNENIHITAL